MGRDRFSNTELKNLPLTMAYVPFQTIEGTYNRDEALKAGTLFPNLDKPFLGRMP
ncbi:MAG: spore coat associated protein CotJA [Clostridia bacterium]|nr:spore coat associated protein CotJA [Clostridia bacterium]